jgi:hypothetical protein
MMTKNEALEFLECSKRTLNRYAKAGKLSVTYEKTSNGLEARYDKKELEVLKAENAPTHRALAVVAGDIGQNGTADVGNNGNGGTGDGEIYRPAITMLEITHEIAVKLTEIIAIHASHLKSSPFDIYRDLEEASQSNWIIPTSTLRDVLGVKPRGKIFYRCGFVFTRTERIGREIGWKVTKGDERNE